MASASAGAAHDQAASTISQTTQFEARATQVKALTNAVPKLASAKENNTTNAGTAKENQNPNTGRGNGTSGLTANHKPQMTKLQNMGGYCHSHGFHPVGLNHNSHTCTYKKEGHKDEAIWFNWLGVDMFWPSAKRTALEQHDNPTWKGKTAPTV